MEQEREGGRPSPVIRGMPLQTASLLAILGTLLVEKINDTHCKIFSCSRVYIKMRRQQGQRPRQLDLQRKQRVQQNRPKSCRCNITGNDNTSEA